MTVAWEDASFRLDVSKIGRQHLVANMKVAGDKEEIVQKGNIYVVLLNGERIVIDYGVVSTVLALRQQIYAKNRIEIAKQKLVYNGVELMVSRIRNTSCLIAIWPYSSCIHRTIPTKTEPRN